MQEGLIKNVRKFYRFPNVGEFDGANYVKKEKTAVLKNVKFIFLIIRVRADSIKLTIKIKNMKKIH